MLFLIFSFNTTRDIITFLFFFFFSLWNHIKQSKVVMSWLSTNHFSSSMTPTKAKYLQYLKYFNLQQNYLLRSSFKDILDSTLTKSIGGGATTWCRIKEQAPRTHWIAKRNKDNNKEHRNQPIATKYSSPTYETTR